MWVAGVYIKGGWLAGGSRLVAFDGERTTIRRQRDRVNRITVRIRFNRRHAVPTFAKVT